MSGKSVFISYRRDMVGRSFARSITQGLTHRGYDTFLDVDSIESGSWAHHLHAVALRDTLSPTA